MLSDRCSEHHACTNVYEEGWQERAANDSLHDARTGLKISSL